MVSILVNWIYMGILVFLTGMALMQGYCSLMEKVNKQKSGIDFGVGHALFAGILGTTLYAQIFSLFYRVNLEANIVLLIIVFGYGVWQRKYLVKKLTCWQDVYAFMGKWKVLLYVLIGAAVIAFSLSSAGPAKLIDTDWYHAQTIRWIEEYGCVKGVANLFYALGFNNAQHYFDALFSMECFFGQSLRGTGGFFGVVIFLHGILRVCNWKSHAHHIADMLAVWEIAYSIIVTAFFADPYVDTLPNILVLFILTEWFALLEEKKEDTVWFGFYCLLAVFATVCKTSVAMIVLLTVYPVTLLIQQKKAKQIPLFLGIGFFSAIPFLITNIITTGYPIYLLSAIDLFDVKWKIDPAVLEYSVDNMVAFARMPLATMEEALNSGLKWIPGWFAAESISHKILYVAIVIFVIYDLVCVLIKLVKKENVDFWMFWPRVCVYCGLVYWFFTIPQVKYCWSFLIAPAAVVPMYYMEKWNEDFENGRADAQKGNDTFQAFLVKGKEWSMGKEHTLVQKGLLLLSLALLLMYTGFYSLRTLGYMKDGIMKYPIMQTDYENHVFDKVEKNGHTFYTRIDNGDIVCGYYIFPYLDNKGDLERLVVGDSLGEGFYFEQMDK